MLGKVKSSGPGQLRSSTAASRLEPAFLCVTLRAFFALKLIRKFAAGKPPHCQRKKAASRKAA
jgi:hypothetical protein